MTVSSSTNSASYSGNGSTTGFAYGFKIFEDSDLTVTLVNDTTGVETAQTLTTHYTVSGAGTNSGGSVTFVTAPASGNTVKIERILSHTQPTAYTENDAFPAQAHEDGLDRLTMLTQQAPAYRSGTFVPVVADAATSGNTASVGTAYGRYIKIGRLVHVTIQLTNINTTGMTGTNSLYVRNLPFTAVNLASNTLYYHGSMTTLNVNVESDGPYFPVVLDNTSYILFNRSLDDGAEFDPLLVSEITSPTGDIYLSVVYEASS